MLSPLKTNPYKCNWFILKKKSEKENCASKPRYSTVHSHFALTQKDFFIVWVCALSSAPATPQAAALLRSRSIHNRAHVKIGVRTGKHPVIFTMLSECSPCKISAHLRSFSFAFNKSSCRSFCVICVDVNASLCAYHVRSWTCGNCVLAMGNNSKNTNVSMMER